MAKSSTPKVCMNVQHETQAGYSLKESRINPIEISPSDHVIRNILNYSKALSVVPLATTGSFSLILLN